VSTKVVDGRRWSRRPVSFRACVKCRLAQPMENLPMNPVNNVGKTYSPVSVQKVLSKPIQKELPVESKPSTAVDKLELSGVDQLLKTLKSNGDIRADKVAEIKAQIAAGKYEDDAKLDIAADKLLDDLFD
jgi:anti-sigma28 factor (negative regulator of flagellin synthesis)